MRGIVAFAVLGVLAFVASGREAHAGTDPAAAASGRRRPNGR